MVFKNEKELERFLLKKCRSALLKAQEKAYQIIKQFLYKFYNDYDTDWARTLQFLQSLVQSRIVSDGKGYKAEIYFALDKLSYGIDRPSGEEVMAAASKGYHGAMGENGEFWYFDGNKRIGVWDGGSQNPIEKLDAEAIDILVDMLKAEGIPVQKG